MCFSLIIIGMKFSCLILEIISTFVSGFRLLNYERFHRMDPLLIVFLSPDCLYNSRSGFINGFAVRCYPELRQRVAALAF